MFPRWRAAHRLRHWNTHETRGLGVRIAVPRPCRRHQRRIVRPEAVVHAQRYPGHHVKRPRSAVRHRGVSALADRRPAARVPGATPATSSTSRTFVCIHSGACTSTSERPDYSTASASCAVRGSATNPNAVPLCRLCVCPCIGRFPVLIMFLKCLCFLSRTGGVAFLQTRTRCSISTTQSRSPRSLSGYTDTSTGWGFRDK